MSGLYRLKREGKLSSDEVSHAISRLSHLRARWDRIKPTEALLETAERLLGITN